MPSCGPGLGSSSPEVFTVDLPQHLLMRTQPLHDCELTSSGMKAKQRPATSCVGDYGPVIHHVATDPGRVEMALRGFLEVPKLLTATI